MSKQGELLHELIQSMNGAEKGHFVKFAQARNTFDRNNRHLMLFKELSTMPVYDEKLLNARLRELDFPEQVHRIRNYLYTFILRFLEYKDQVSIEGEVLQLTKFAFILHKRGLWDQAEKMIRRALKVCDEHGISGLKYELLTLLRRIKVNSIQLKEVRHLTQNEIIDTAGQIYKAAFLQQGVSRIASQYRLTGFPKNQTELRFYQNIRNEIIEIIGDEKLKGRALITYQNFEFFYNYALGKDEESIHWCNKRISTLKEYILADDNIMAATTTHSSLILRLLDLNKIEEAIEKQAEYKNFINGMRSEIDRSLIPGFNIDQILLLRDVFISVKAYPFKQNLQLPKMLEKAKALEHELIEQDIGEFHHLALFSTVAYMYLSDHKTALKYLIKLRGEKLLKYTVENENVTTILLVLCYAQMNKLDSLSTLLSGLLRSTDHLAWSTDIGILQMLTENALCALDSTSDFKNTFKDLSIKALGALNEETQNKLGRLTIDLEWYFKHVF